MSDMTCKKTMQRCNTPGMCAPHGGCQSEKSEWQSGYDEGRRMGVKHMYAEVERLKVENEALRKGSVRYEWLRDKQTFIWLIQDWFPSDAEFTDVDAVIDAAMGSGDKT